MPSTCLYLLIKYLKVGLTNINEKKYIFQIYHGRMEMKENYSDISITKPIKTERGIDILLVSNGNNLSAKTSCNKAI